MADEEKNTPGEVTSEGTGDGAPGTATPAATPEAGSGGGGADWQAERAQLLERLSALEGTVRQGAGAGGDTPTTASDPERAEIARRYQENQNQLAEARRLAASGDPAMGLLVKSLEATATDLQRMNARLQIADYVSELEPEHRKPFRAYLAKNGNRFADLDAAFDAYEATLLRGQRATTKTAQQRADAIAKDRAEGRVGTDLRAVPASEDKARRMSETDFDATVESLRSKGDFEGARELGRRLSRGEIVFK